MSKSYMLVTHGEENKSIIVNDDEMLVYDVCKIADYEGGDYVPRKARQMANVVLPIGDQDETTE